MLTLIPSVVHQLVNHPDFRKVDLSSVQNISSGAAYLPPDLALKMISIVPEGCVLAQGLSLCIRSQAMCLLYIHPISLGFGMSECVRTLI